MSLYKKRFIVWLFTCGILFSLVSINLMPSAEGLKGALFKKSVDETYYTYDQFTNLLYQLNQEYADIFSYSSLGKTYEGRDIWLVKISDNVTINEEEQKVFYTGGMHGDEKQGYQVVIYSIKAIVENYTYLNVNQSFTERVRNVVNNTELYFIPMLNPDGCEAGTRKNCRPNNCPLGKTLFCGVDIGRNSGYKWELQDQYPFRYRRSTYIEKVNIKYPIFDFRSLIGEGCYRGPYPFSEPESRAIKQVVENHSISIYMDYHSAANHICYGWAWNHDHPLPEEPIMSSIAQGISNMTGYVIKRGSMSMIFGNMRDWMSSEHGVLAFAMELPRTKADRPLLDILHGNRHPLPWKNIPILEMCKTHVLVNLYLAERAMMTVS